MAQTILRRSAVLYKEVSSYLQNAAPGSVNAKSNVRSAAQSSDRGDVNGNIEGRTGPPWDKAVAKEGAKTAVLDQTIRRAAQNIQPAAPIAPQFENTFQPQTIYSPRDLLFHEPRYNKKPLRDVFIHNEIDPLEHYKSITMLSNYVTDMGRILHPDQTGLRPRTQRRLAKAIRRARAIGLMPTQHKHPEIARRFG